MRNIDSIDDDDNQFPRTERGFSTKGQCRIDRDNFQAKMFIQQDSSI